MTDPSSDFDLAHYDFEVPPELIAQEPAAERSASRLLVVDRARGAIEHSSFAELPALLAGGDRLVLNRTRVIPARAWGVRTATGGHVELLFCEEAEDATWQALIKTRGKPRVGETIAIEGCDATVELLEKLERGRWTVRPSEAPAGFLERVGVMPLPPYVKREGAGRDREDRERYQTVFAEAPGAVAAPTAGLHFTDEILGDLAARGVERSFVTLHVGLGTFLPIESDDVRDHRMHEERYEVSERTAAEVNATRTAGRRVIAVGTTSVRSLESAWDGDAVVASGGRTDLYVHPPMTIASVDGLLTNFHLPKSSLILLVAAFAGRELILEAYREAVSSRYRFFSYGDAMLIL